MIRYNLGDIDRVLALSSDPLLRFQKIALTPADGYVLSRVDGTPRAREVLELIPLPAVETQRSLFGLLSTGVVEFCRGRPRRRRPARRRCAAARRGRRESREVPAAARQTVPETAAADAPPARAGGGSAPPEVAPSPRTRGGWRSSRPTRA